MNLKQNKLSKDEWNSIEIPINDNDKKILKLIMDGYNDIDICVNYNNSLLQHMKIQNTKEIEYYIYKNILEKHIIEINNNFIIQEIKKKNIKNIILKSEFINKKIIEWIKKTDNKKIKNPNKINLLRIQNLLKDNIIKNISYYDLYNINENSKNIYEFILLELCYSLFISYIYGNNDNIELSLTKKIKNILENPFEYYYYTLLIIKNNSITDINEYLINFVNYICDIFYYDNIKYINNIFYNSNNIIEHNNYILKYEDNKLYNHQKELFKLFKNNNNPKLILYIAPTGTGKTLSPIGLSNEYKIIFVCVARHIGLELARSLISLNKRIAFAFGCELQTDIRLHNLSAQVYTKNNNTGNMKIDNSYGQKVEIMICDVKSYIISMNYMLLFNDEKNIITYWDEPTITMDYEYHELHDIIHNNWIQNKISKVVLSCATLPKEKELSNTINSFKSNFINSTIHTIESYDCKKSIEILNKEGYIILPHILFYNNINLLYDSINHCIENKTMLRYLNLNDICIFIKKIENYIPDNFKINNYFNNIINLNMFSIKMYYINLLKYIIENNINIDDIKEILNDINNNKKNKFEKNKIIKINSDIHDINTKSSVNLHNLSNKSKLNIINYDGILLTTKDAHTLTDGPTIYIVNDIEKLEEFYITQSKIPERILNKLKLNIEHNDNIQNKINILQKKIDDELGKDINKNKKMEKMENSDIIKNKNIKNYMDDLKILQEQINIIQLDKYYIPNTIPHQEIWNDDNYIKNAYIPKINEKDIKDILKLNIHINKKILLLLGIGIFVNSNNINDDNHIKYTEIIKKLSYQQNLYLIIASSDYIYGTNYNFCHGFLGKDLLNMTQQKIIQSIGRIGRNNIQQDYTIRFRDDNILKKLFLPELYNLESNMMNKLFS